MYIGGWRCGAAPARCVRVAAWRAAAALAAAALAAGCGVSASGAPGSGAPGSGAPGSGASRSSEARLSRALAAWSGFPAGASPRPLVLTGPRVADPAGGFPAGASKLAYLERAVTIAAALPAGPRRAGGYPLVSAAEAVKVFTSSGAKGPPVSARLTVSSVRLGTAVFQTDRGLRRLPAWLLAFSGVQRTAGVLAVAPAGIYVPPAHPSGEPDGTAARVGGGRTLTLTFTGARAGTGPCTASYHLKIAESRTAVAVIVRGHEHGDGPCAAIGYRRSATAVLSAPLGARVVVDAATDTAIPVTVAPAAHR